jgi:hypothetical protein
MRKEHLLAAVAASLFLACPTWAHHGEHHEPEIPVPEVPVDVPSTSVYVPPPVVPMPPPVFIPPPVVQTPVVQASVAAPVVLPVIADPVVSPPVNSTLPMMAPLSGLVPTDLTGAKMPVEAATKSDIDNALTELTDADPRFEFFQDWILFSDSCAKIAGLSGSYRQVALAEPQDGKQFGRIEFVEKSPPPKSASAAFLPTRNAKYHKVNDEHLSLDAGAILVRAGQKPVFVSQAVNGHKILTRITGGALAMISAQDGNCTVLNLTDKCCGALVCYVPTPDGKGSEALHVKAGQVSEVYPTDTKPFSNLVATKIVVNKRCTNDIGLLVSNCNYLRAFKRYNLRMVLERADLDRVLKTAAAVAHVRRHH